MAPLSRLEPLCGSIHPLPPWRSWLRGKGRGGAPSQLKLSIRIQPKPQRLRPDERHCITAPLPVGGRAEIGDQLIVHRGLCVRATAVLHRAGDEDDGVAGDRELPLPPLHHNSTRASPASPISRLGIRFEPG